jgi:hypothetical protein
MGQRAVPPHAGCDRCVSPAGDGQPGRASAVLRAIRGPKEGTGARAHTFQAWPPATQSLSHRRASLLDCNRRTGALLHRHRPPKAPISALSRAGREDFPGVTSCIEKTTPVTDASGRSGAAASTALANAGARVLVHHRHPTASVEALVKAILRSGGVARAIATDVSTVEGSRLLARQARGIVGDRLDVLVLNAGGPTSPALPGAHAGADGSEEAFDRLPGSAPFLPVQLLRPILAQGSSVPFPLSFTGTTMRARMTAPVGRAPVFRESRQ